MIRRFAKYYKPYMRTFIFDLIAALAVAACNLLLPMVTRQILNTLIPDNNLTMVIVWGVVLLGCYLTKVALNYYMCCQGHIMGAKMQADMRRDLFSHLEKLPCTYFDNHKTGELMSRMTSDLFDVSELAHHGPEDLFISVVQFAGTFIILMHINPFLTLISFAVIPPMVFFVAKLRRKLGAASKQSRKEIAELNAGLENSISGVRVTRAFNARAYEEEGFARNNHAYLVSRSKFCHAMGVFHGWMGFGTDLLSFLVLTIGGILIITTGRNGSAPMIDYVDLLTFMLYVTVFAQPIVKLAAFTEQYENGMTGFTRFTEILDEPAEEDAPDAVTVPDVRGDIAFENVSFSYSDSAEILHDMSFSVKAGTTIALVGSSGGGKTTVCHLIPRFYETTSGTITIDGTDITRFTRESLRANIGMVAQDVFLFNATIYENIAYGCPDATEETVAEAAKRAKLHDYIMTLPNGYRTEVGERGVKLSGGQKQRIAIARVFLKNPPILILDEATSALDNITERQIQESLNDLCRGRTTIVVAHRLSTVRGADEIFYIEDGVIRERGNHASLMAQNGEYACLVHSSEPLQQA